MAVVETLVDTMTDAQFNALFPPEVRRVAGKYWTPVDVARRAAEILVELGAYRVLDVGSGPGKFCVVAGARAPNISFVGIEHRAHLVTVANAVADAVNARNATFRLGDVTRSSWADFDAFYVFNSFAENGFSSDEQLDQTVELSRGRRVADVMRVERWLAEASIGTIVVTYHGLGGPIPASYERVHVEEAGTGWLQVWRQQDEQQQRDEATTGGSGGDDNAMYWVEDGADINLVTADEIGQCFQQIDDSHLFIRSIFARP